MILTFLNIFFGSCSLTILIYIVVDRLAEYVKEKKHRLGRLIWEAERYQILAKEKLEAEKSKHSHLVGKKVLIHVAADGPQPHYLGVFNNTKGTVRALGTDDGFSIGELDGTVVAIIGTSKGRCTPYIKDVRLLASKS